MECNHVNCHCGLRICDEIKPRTEDNVEWVVAANDAEFTNHFSLASLCPIPVGLIWILLLAWHCYPSFLVAFPWSLVAFPSLVYFAFPYHLAAFPCCSAFPWQACPYLLACPSLQDKISSLFKSTSERQSIWWHLYIQKAAVTFHVGRGRERSLTFSTNTRHVQKKKLIFLFARLCFFSVILFTVELTHWLLLHHARLRGPQVHLRHACRQSRHVRRPTWWTRHTGRCNARFWG